MLGFVVLLCVGVMLYWCCYDSFVLFGALFCFAEFCVGCVYVVVCCGCVDTLSKCGDVCLLVCCVVCLFCGVCDVVVLLAVCHDMCGDVVVWSGLWFSCLRVVLCCLFVGGVIALIRIDLMCAWCDVLVWVVMVCWVCVYGLRCDVRVVFVLVCLFVVLLLVWCVELCCVVVCGLVWFGLV